MEDNPLERLYIVFAKPQTYLNLLYLFLAFPLGIAYFVFLVTGISLGFGLLVIWIGAVILAGVLALCWPLTLFERQLAISLLHVDMPPRCDTTPSGGTLFEQAKAHLSNPATWKGIAFLFLKFPIGIASFVITVTLVSLSLGLLLAPLGYPWVQINIGNLRLSSMSAAMVAFCLGLVVAPFSLHFLNLMAGWLGQFAKIMLCNPVPAQPQAPLPVQPQAPAPVAPPTEAGL